MVLVLCSCVCDLNNTSDNFAMRSKSGRRDNNTQKQIQDQII